MRKNKISMILVMLLTVALIASQSISIFATGSESKKDRVEQKITEQRSRFHKESLENNGKEDDEPLVKFTEYYTYDEDFEEYSNIADACPFIGDSISTTVEFDDSISTPITYVGTSFTSDEGNDESANCTYNPNTQTFAISNTELLRMEKLSESWIGLSVEFKDNDGQQVFGFLNIYTGYKYVVEFLNLEVGTETIIKKNNTLKIETYDGTVYKEDVTITSAKILSDGANTISLKSCTEGWKVSALQEALDEDSAIIQIEYKMKSGETEQENIEVWVYEFWPGDVRISGDTRYETSLAVAETFAERWDEFNSIVVATGENYPDALTGDYLANMADGPMLLVGKDSTSQNNVVSFIEDYLGEEGTVYILGGTSAVPKRFESKLKEFMDDDNIVRLAGDDRYETNLRVIETAEDIVDSWEDWEETEKAKPEDDYDRTILIATGAGYADALSASAVPYPIMLVSGSTLTSGQKNFIEEYDVDSAYIVGGTAAVKTSIETQLENRGVDVLERFAGDNRFDTSKLIADYFFGLGNDFLGGNNAVILTTGYNFPDGLSGGPMAWNIGAPILLVSKNSSEYKYAKEFVNENDMIHCVVLGGTSAVSNKTVNAVMGW